MDILSRCCCPSYFLTFLFDDIYLDDSCMSYFVLTFVLNKPLECEFHVKFVFIKNDREYRLKKDVGVIIM